MYLVEELATEESRHKIEQAEQLRPARRLLTLRRARRMEQKAERRSSVAQERCLRNRHIVHCSPTSLSRQARSGLVNRMGVTL